ncbi:MAG TPA: hypothetical protein VLL25_13310 [Acidimicrobiales bacterium]|nr:hypothetical protein [Acidimicrobiales bacterium]
MRRWEELSRRSADNLPWYKVYAGFQFGVLMIRLAHLMVQFELFPQTRTTSATTA